MHLGGIALGGLVWEGAPVAAQSRANRESAAALLGRVAAFDLHTHPGALFGRGSDGYGGDGGVAARFRDMVDGRLAGAFVSLVADRKILHIGPPGPRATRTFDEGEAWLDYRQQIADLRELLAQAPAREATGPADLPAAPGAEIAAFIAVEGGDCLDGRVDRVEGLYADGVRSLQLVHYAPNAIGDLQTETPVHAGLSAFGHQVVAEMERFGMVIDVAHASLETVRAVAEQTATPLLLSHSQLQTGDNRHPRLITTEHAEVVAGSGGVIGMWPSGIGNESFEDFVDHTRRLVDLVGIEHVGLGTDMDANYMPVFDNYGQLVDWTAGLLGTGLSEEEVGKLTGGNAQRLLTSVLRQEDF
ncbi:MAG: membrane dipeptidase [Acidobacteriota bacterium]|nr:membrane dipeptidase [Acidobacteriota bacterium]